MAKIKETFPAHWFEVSDLKESKISKGFRHLIIDYIDCPHCDGTLEPLHHGESATCPNCGLHITKFGNALHCTLEQ
jgi:uncharacterized paraquat-inducible protein A